MQYVHHARIYHTYVRTHLYARRSSIVDTRVRREVAASGRVASRWTRDLSTARTVPSLCPERSASLTVSQPRPITVQVQRERPPLCSLDRLGDTREPQTPSLPRSVGGRKRPLPGLVVPAEPRGSFRHNRAYDDSPEARRPAEKRQRTSYGGVGLPRELPLTARTSAPARGTASRADQQRLLLERAEEGYAGDEWQHERLREETIRQTRMGDGNEELVADIQREVEYSLHRIRMNRRLGEIQCGLFVMNSPLDRFMIRVGLLHLSDRMPEVQQRTIFDAEEDSRAGWTLLHVLIEELRMGRECGWGLLPEACSIVPPEIIPECTKPQQRPPNMSALQMLVVWRSRRRAPQEGCVADPTEARRRPSRDALQDGQRASHGSRRRQ